VPTTTVIVKISILRIFGLIDGNFGFLILHRPELWDLEEAADERRNDQHQQPCESK